MLRYKKISVRYRYISFYTEKYLIYFKSTTLLFKNIIYYFGISIYIENFQISYRYRIKNLVSVPYRTKNFDKFNIV